MLFVVSYLLHYSSQQLAHKFGLLVSLVITAVVALALVVIIPPIWLVGILVIVSSVAVLLLSIFTGWQMKISHLRKSLNFGSEGLYNLWRVAIRLVVPLALLLALVGWVMQWLRVFLTTSENHSANALLQSDQPAFMTVYLAYAEDERRQHYLSLQIQHGATLYEALAQSGWLSKFTRIG